MGRRARRTIRQNLLFTAAYNVVGLTLAACGVLPPALAAAAHGLPDVAILLNSGRLARIGPRHGKHRSRDGRRLHRDCLRHEGAASCDP